MGVTQMVVLGIALALVAWAVVAYNGLVRQRNEIANAFAQIDVQLKRRHDLVPNLVEAARKYVQHERETLEAVIAARNTARGIGALAGAEQMLDGALSRLMAVVERYPELKADGTLRELSEELTHTENRIAFARQAFNDSVLDYNNAAQQAPANVVAGVFGFRAAAMLQATSSDAEREVPRIKL